MMENNRDNFEIDSGLYELRRRYIEMKKERQKTQKDADQLTNKLKLLSTEEVKVQKRGLLEREKQEDLDKIRQDLLMEKELLCNMRIEKEKNLEKNKQMIYGMRNEIKSAIKTWRSNVTQKNKFELDKMKMKKIENEQLVEINKKENELKNRAICEQVKYEKLTASEKKKKEEVLYYI